MESRAKHLQSWALALFSKSYQIKFSRDGRLHHKDFQEYLKNAIKDKRKALMSQSVVPGNNNGKRTGFLSSLTFF